MPQRRSPSEVGARVVQQDWLGYVGQKNLALDHASHPWVLSIDADEEISPELAAAIARVKADPASDSPAAPNGYRIFPGLFFTGVNGSVMAIGIPTAWCGFFAARKRDSAAAACTRSLNFPASIPFCRDICIISLMTTPPTAPNAALDTPRFGPNRPTSNSGNVCRLGAERGSTPAGPFRPRAFPQARFSGRRCRLGHRHGQRARSPAQISTSPGIEP